MASRSPTLVEKLSLFPHVVVGLSVGTLQLATRAFANDVRPPTAYQDFVFAVGRHVLGKMTIPVEKWLAVPTETVYLKFAKDRSIEPDTTVLESGLKLHWIGDKAADKVVLYFHGGGYVNAASPQHLEWLLELQTELSKKGKVAIAVVGYTCAPEGQYPVQLREGAESLVWLLGAGGKKPENVFIGGDSAGGNLALALLSHILHPHPKFEDELRVKLSAPLAGAILTSPWVKFPTTDDSAKRNEGGDFICKPAGDRWAAAFNGSAPYDSYTQALLAPKDWFNNLDKVVKGVLILGGGHELLIDSIEEIAQKLKDSFPSTTYVRIEEGAHVGWLSHKIFGIKEKEESGEAIESWMAARL